MSNVEKFEELLRTDEALQAKLRAAGEAYEGDWSDERAVFDAVIAPLAEEEGVPFSFDEVSEYVQAGAELSDEDLDAVAGGKHGCLIVGTGGTGACSTEYAGAIACKVVGAGFFEM